MNEQIERAIRYFEQELIEMPRDISIDQEACERCLAHVNVAIQALREKQERLGKAWTMYENEGAICHNCIEHVCKGWNFCPECGEKLPAPPEPKEG